MLIVLLVLIVLIGVVAGIVQIVENQSRLDREARELNLNVSPAHGDPHTFVRQTASRPLVHQCDMLGLRFALSADRKTAYLLYSTKQPTLTVPASKITGCRIISEGHYLSLGGAVAGGVLAGDAGAILGAVSKTHIPVRYSLVIYLNDPFRPSVEYALLTPSGSHAQVAYDTVSRFAESVSSTVRALAKQNRSH